MGFAGATVITSREALIAFGRWCVSQGAWCSQHPNFDRDGYHPVADWSRVNSAFHVKGSWHNDGLAIDINYGPPGAPSSERDWVTKKAIPMAKKLGIACHYSLYGHVRNHDDHLHVDAANYENLGYGLRRISKVSNQSALVGTLLAGGGIVNNPSGKIICKGDRGGEVKALQRYLNSRSGVKPKIEEDGVFGDDTERALKQWQGNNHLRRDGRWGNRCIAKRKELAERARVKRFQRKIGVRADGVEGKITKHKVRQVQERLGVHVDGKWGPKTNRAWHKFVDGALGPRTIIQWQINAGTPRDGVISKPSKLIRKVQAQKKNIQKKNRIPRKRRDGVLGPETWRLICDSMGRPAHSKPTKADIRALQRRILRGRY